MPRPEISPDVVELVDELFTEYTDRNPDIAFAEKVEWLARRHAKLEPRARQLKRDIENGIVMSPTRTRRNHSPFGMERDEDDEPVGPTTTKVHLPE
jgi:hypothetical protein